METESLNNEILLKGDLNSVKQDLGIRSKTSLRMVYEAQVLVIKKQLGSLEKIRTDLGLSQRKMSQLLMVDPSAWTRWNKSGEEAPPHIWRALQWYMALQEKIPGLTPQYFIGKDPQILHEKALLQIKTLRSHFEEQNAQIFADLQKEVRFHRRLSYSMIALSLVMAAATVFSFVTH
ncbi:MAG: hypothetical protein IPM97_06095 [Bdellovibrionaceae bacterium]|nr:hypothetical protein [Pseudobdellovibrionaceae bacterium]